MKLCRHDDELDVVDGRRIYGNGNATERSTMVAFISYSRFSRLPRVLLNNDQTVQIALFIYVLISFYVDTR
jgi:hypothetical protein